MARLFAATILGNVLVLVAQNSQQAQDGSSEPCVWPDCEPRCLPCKYDSRKVGGCFFGSCDKSRGPTDCESGKCLCKEGYCANEDLSQCEPQICLSGAKPPKFEPNNWVYFYSSMADDMDFPKWDEIQSNPMGLALQVCAVPVLMLLLGVLIALTVFSCMCCRRSEIQYDDDGQYSDSSGRALKLRGRASSPRSRHAVSPSLWPLMLLAISIIGLCVGGFIIRQNSFVGTSAVIDHALRRAEHDTVTVADACLTVNSTVNTLKEKLEEVLPECSKASSKAAPIVRGLNDMVMGKLDTYVDMGYGIIDTVQTIPHYVKDVQIFIDSWKPAFVYLPMVPIVLMTAVCVWIIIFVLMAKHCDNEKFDKCQERSMRYGAGGFCLVILVVAVLATAETTVMIVVSKYCLRPGHNTRDIVNATTSNISALIPEITNAYIAGIGDNPIRDYEVMVVDIINKVDSIYDKAQAALLLLGNPCPQILELGVVNITNTARGIVGDAKKILQTRNIYPYYDEILDKGVCGAVVNSISWMWVLQILVGFVLFPLCAIYAFSYMEDLAAWMRLEKHGDGGGDSEEGSD